jgi:hypothetical protein
MLGSAVRAYSSSNTSGSFGDVESAFGALADSDFDARLELPLEASATFVSLKAVPPLPSTHPVTLTVSLLAIDRDAVAGAGYVGLCEEPGAGVPGAGAWAPSAAQVMRTAVEMRATFMMLSPLSLFAVFTTTNAPEEAARGPRAWSTRPRH